MLAFVSRWTLGSILFLSSFAAMMGPVAYAQHLMSAPRLPFTAAYLGSLALSLYFALGVSQTGSLSISSLMLSLFLLASQYDPNIDFRPYPTCLFAMVSYQLLPDGLQRPTPSDIFWCKTSSDMDDWLSNPKSNEEDSLSTCNYTCVIASVTRRPCILAALVYTRCCSRLVSMACFLLAKFCNITPDYDVAVPPRPKAIRGLFRSFIIRVSNIYQGDDKAGPIACIVFYSMIVRARHDSPWGAEQQVSEKKLVAILLVKS
jgi:hypothetical protein